MALLCNHVKEQIQESEVNMNTKLALMLVTLVLGTGASVGFQNASDFTVAMVVAVLLTPMLSPWLRNWFN
jgi:hypothetical protein